jgi:hypothetical protein
MEQVDAGLDGQFELPIEEDEETLAAIGQGIPDADSGRLTSLGEVEALIPPWVSESSSPAGHRQTTAAHFLSRCRDKLITLKRMAVSVNITPEVEAQLVARASSSGESLDAFLQRLLEREAAAPGGNCSPVSPGSQKARAFRAWAYSFPATMPVLSLESISRENMYRLD